MSKPYNELTNSDKEKIITLFKEGKMIKEIPGILGISERSVSRVLKDNKINSHRINRYELNENYFDTIDCEKKAYILGLLFSDGFIGDEKHNNISLSITEKDKDILEKIKDEIEFTGELRKNYNHGYNSQKPTYVLNFSSKHMCESLRKIGLKNVKSKRDTIIPYNLDEELVRHYIRGYFDGDGSFIVGQSRESRKLADGSIKTYCYLKPRLSIIVPEKFAKEFISRIPGNISIKKSHTKGLVYLENSAKNNVENLYHYFYDNATIFIERKRDNFLNFMERLARDC